MPKIIIILLLLQFSLSQKPPTCPQNCASCPRNSSACSACTQNFEPSHTGACIPSSTIENCQLFGVRDTCIICKPTFRLLANNTCAKMWDGCLIAGPMGSCNRCMDGAVRNQFGQCSTRSLNCLKTNPSGECILCEQRGYRLQNDKCINSDPNCNESQPLNGLCKACKQGYRLLEYRCIKNEELPNCYIVAPDGLTCSICKIGYESYYGRCQTMEYIDQQIYQSPVTAAENKLIKKCPATQYYNLLTGLCYPLPAFCERFDYGLRRCVSCLGGFVIQGTFCRDPSLKYCDKIDTSNPYICSSCSPQYFLTVTKLCKQFPPFCQEVTNQRCTKCIDLFLLNEKGLCEDPNCQSFDSVSNLCTKCKDSYFKNATTSICTFRDVNCVELGPGQTCLRCRDSYVYDGWKKICKFRDPECKIFSQKDACLECRANYYLNSKTNICMELPYKCLSADSQGNCEYCSQGYSLTSSRQCSLIVNISNCQMPSPYNPNVCQKCNEGYYKDERDACVELPVFCELFDGVKRVCARCARNSVLRNGLCFDIFCQYFGEGTECLGCKPGYQYGAKGECVPEKNDPNCKQFQNGQCKVCSDRFYFDSQWKCTPISSLCRLYDSNSGECTSCYSGYALEDGKCIRESERVICEEWENQSKARCVRCRASYQLGERDGLCYYSQGGCVRRNVTNRACLRCMEGYLLDENMGLCLKITNSSYTPSSNTTDPLAPPAPEQPPYLDPNCIQLTANKSACQSCISRMYYSASQQKCTAIDPNCRTYSPATGQCTSCYDGYNVTDSRMGCQLAKPRDKNCKTFRANGQGCEECYGGFYEDKGKGECAEVDALCKQVNLANGECLSCWAGYLLKIGRCVDENAINALNSVVTVDTLTITPAASPVISPIAPSPPPPVKPLKCQQFDPVKQICTKCIKSTVMDQQLQSCEYPIFGYDTFCLEYRNRLCTKCKEGYQLKSQVCKKL